MTTSQNGAFSSERFMIRFQICITTCIKKGCLLIWSPILPFRDISTLHMSRKSWFRLAFGTLTFFYLEYTVWKNTVPKYSILARYFNKFCSLIYLWNSLLHWFFVNAMYRKRLLYPKSMMQFILDFKLNKLGHSRRSNFLQTWHFPYSISKLVKS